MWSDFLETIVQEVGRLREEVAAKQRQIEELQRPKKGLILRGTVEVTVTTIPDREGLLKLTPTELGQLFASVKGEQLTRLLAEYERVSTTRRRVFEVLAKATGCGTV